MMIWQDVKKESPAPPQGDAVKSAPLTVLDNGQPKHTTVSEALKRGGSIDIRLQAIREAARLCHAGPKGEAGAQAAGEVEEWVLNNIFYKSAKRNQWVAVSNKPEQLGAMLYEAYKVADGYPAVQDAFFKHVSEWSTGADTSAFWELLIGARKEFERLGGPSNSWQTNLDLVARRQEQPLQHVAESPPTAEQKEALSKTIPQPVTGREEGSEQVSEIDTDALLSSMRGRPPEGQTDSYSARFDAALRLSNLASRSENPEQAGALAGSILTAAISEKGGKFSIPIKRVEKDAASGELTTDAAESEKRVQSFLKLAYRATSSCPTERAALLKRLQSIADRAEGSPDEYIIKSGLQQMAAAALEEFTYYSSIASGKIAVPPEGVKPADAAGAKAWLNANSGLLPAILGALGDGSALEFYPTVRTSVENSLSFLSGLPSYAADAAGSLDRLDFYAGTEQQAEYKKRSALTLARSLEANPKAEGSVQVVKSLVLIGLANLDEQTQAAVYSILAGDLALLSQAVITSCGLDARLGAEGSLLKPVQKLFSFEPDSASFGSARDEYNKAAGGRFIVNLTLTDSDFDALDRRGSELRRGLFQLKREGEMISIYPVMPLRPLTPEAERLLGTLFQYAHSRMMAGGQAKDDFVGGENAKLVMADKKGRTYTGSEQDYAEYLFRSVRSILADSPDRAQPGSESSRLADLCGYYLQRLAEDRKRR